MDSESVRDSVSSLDTIIMMIMMMIFSCVYRCDGFSRYATTDDFVNADEGENAPANDEEETF